MTALESHLQECAAITHRIREGIAPEPLTDEMMDKIPISKPVVPAECVTPAPQGIPDQVRSFMGADQRKATAWNRLHARLTPDGRGTVSAADLTMDGYIDVSYAKGFLSALADIGYLTAVVGRRTALVTQANWMRPVYLTQYRRAA